MLDAIAAVVAARVVDALRPLLVAAQAPATSALVSRLELARLLAVSAATVTRLTAEGLVCTYVGDSPRYDVEAVRVWLAERGAKPTKAKPSSGPIAGVRLLGRRAAR
jgi:hypothetical protein